MKELVILIRPEKLEDVKKILDDINCGGMTLSTVMGCGTQKGISSDTEETVNEIRGFKTTINLLPKVKVEVVIEDKDVELIGCEAAGKGVDTALTAATIATGSLGIFHGMKSYFCQDEYGQIAPVYSISAGLDYPGIGPEHAYLHDIGRAQYVPITDDEAVDAFEYLARTEGIICAIESAHAVAQVRKIAKNYSPDQSIIVCLSGRGDKDVAAIARYRGVDIHD